jgi:hypothetical protein
MAEVKYTEFEPVIKHWEYKAHLLATLQQERVQIFCIHCGDNKILTTPLTRLIPEYES